MSIRTRSRLAGISALAVAAIFLLSSCSSAPQQENSAAEAPPPVEKPQRAKKASQGPAKDAVRPLAGYRAANFTAVDVFTGQQVTLAELKGQVVFLNFWATWCPPCKAEMPAMEELHQAMGERVRIIALGADAAESKEKMAQFAKSMELTFTVAHDKGMAMEAYQVRGVPTSFFIDKEGIIRARHQGAMTLETMKKYVAGAEKLPEAK